jgi:hypothetical protein
MNGRSERPLCTTGLNGRSINPDGGPVLPFVLLTGH